jgi:hypothetical protein
MGVAIAKKDLKLDVSLSTWLEIPQVRIFEKTENSYAL